MAQCLLKSVVTAVNIVLACSSQASHIFSVCREMHASMSNHERLMDNYSLPSCMLLKIQMHIKTASKKLITGQLWLITLVITTINKQK